MGWIKEQLKMNPRITLPLLGLLATLLSMLLFEPIRTFFIERKLKKKFRNITYLSELIHFGIDFERKDEKKLKSILDEIPRAVTVISAPRGSGKSTVVGNALHERKSVIRIDFSEMDSVPDAEFINFIADCVGYYPTLTWMSQISGWLDILPLGLSKGTFAWTAHSELVNILHCLEEGLLSVAHDSIDDRNKKYPVIVLDGILENLQSMENKKEAALLMDVIAEFAVAVGQKKGLAHVLIISHDPSAARTTQKLISANGGSKVKTVRLGDISKEEAIKFVETCLIPATVEIDKSDIELAVSKLGGRVADLELFTQKVLSGVKPKKELKTMTNRAVSQIRVDGFGFSAGMYSKNGPTEEPRKWTQSQLWKIIKRIAVEEKVSYDDILVSIFNGDVDTFTALLNLNIIRLNKSRIISAYSPLYRSAFQQMVGDKEISVHMESTIIRESLTGCHTQLSKLQDELMKWKNINHYNDSHFHSLIHYMRGLIGKEYQSPITSRGKDLEHEIRSTLLRIKSLQDKQKALSN